MPPFPGVGFPVVADSKRDWITVPEVMVMVTEFEAWLLAESVTVRVTEKVPAEE